MTDYTDTIIRVRYSETDQMGVAHHANYFIWFDVGRTGFCRHFGFEYERMETEDDTFIVVVNASYRYKSPARFDDVLRIHTRATGSQRRTVRYGYEILSETDQLIATGETLHVFLQPPRTRQILAGKVSRIFSSRFHTDTKSKVAAWEDIKKRS